MKSSQQSLVLEIDIEELEQRVAPQADALFLEHPGQIDQADATFLE